MNNFNIQLISPKYKNNFCNLRIRKGDTVHIEYFTEGKYRQVFNGICVDVSGSLINRKIKVFNLAEKVESIFFLNSPNIIKLEFLNKKN